MRFKGVPIEPDGVEEFFATAPFVAHNVRTYPVPPRQLWDVVTSDRMWSWLPTVWGCRYPVDTPPAAGVVRDFQMYIHGWRLYAQHERVIELDAPNVMRYTATDATLPFFGSWCEEYRVIPADDGRAATLDWTLACAPRYLSRIPGIRTVIRPLALILNPIFQFGLRGLVRELPSHAPPALTIDSPPTAIEHP